MNTCPELGSAMARGLAFHLRVLLAVVVAATASATALAQYPTRPVRLVVPFPGGGSMDNMGRIMAQALTQSLGQPVIVDNRPGADGAIGADAVIKSAPDGHVLFFTAGSSILAPATLRAKPPYDPVAAFTPVSLIGRSTFFLFVHSSVPANSISELVAHAKANPGKLNYGTGNSTAIVASAQLLRAAGIEMMRIPYKGDAPGMLDLVSGRVQVMFVSTTSLFAQEKEGKVRSLATLAKRRSPLAPGLPTFAEAGLPRVSIEIWVGLFGPARMPDDVLARLSRDVNAALHKPEVVDQFGRQGSAAEGSTPAELGAFLKEQLAAWAQAVKDAGIQPD